MRLVYMVGLHLNNSWLECLNSCNHKKKLIESCLGTFSVFEPKWFIDLQILVTCSGCKYLIFVSFHVLICHESAFGSVNWNLWDNSRSDSSFTARPNAIYCQRLISCFVKIEWHMKKSTKVQNQVFCVAESSLNMVFLNQVVVIILYRFKQYSCYVDVTTECMRSFIHCACEMPFRYWVY